MKISKICIRNLKSIKYLSLDLEKENKPMTLLYGNNGVGKTTILEAMSLLGHVSCMRKINVTDDTKNSTDSPSDFFSNNSKALNLTSKPHAFDTLKANIKKHHNIDDWAKDFNEKEAALVSFEVVTGETGVQNLKSRRLAFHIYFKQTTHSITQALSKGSSDDVEMSDLFALVYSHSIQADIDALVTHFYNTASHFVRIGGVEKLIPKNIPLGSNIVSYINTDLNDFGRKNDIRESVKDIYRDFGNEIIGRLSLPFDNDGNFTKLNELNVLLKEVIKDYADPNAGHEEALFSIMQLTCLWDTSTKTYSTTIKAERNGEKDKPLDYMSAGENECFFIFMLLLGLPISESIILLDEPDLHLTTLAKETFYNKLFQILDRNNCQVIISTHSLFAYSAEKTLVDRKLIKKTVLKEKINGTTESRIVHEASFDSDYFLKLHTFYWRTAWKAWKVILKTEHVRLRHQSWSNRLEAKFGLRPAKFSLYLAFLPLAFAFLNDQLHKWFGQGAEKHVLIADWLSDFAYVLFFLAGSIWVIGYFFKREK